MDFTIKRGIFLEGIQKTLGIVERKTTMPILNNILIKTEKDGIRIIATDREIGLVADYGADVKTLGEVTVSARKMYEMIREIQGDMIHFEANEQCRVTVTCQKVVYRIPGLPADDFPHVLDDYGDVMFYPVSGQLLGDLIHKTFFAMSGDEMRKNLNGVFFETFGEGSRHVMRMVATDGHRLALANMDAGEGEHLRLEKGIIIPRKGLNEIRKLIDDAPGNVSIGVRKGMCIIRTDSTVLRVSLVDAEYPDYKRVIPVEKGSTVEFGKDAVLRALRRMSVMASERYSGVIISLAPGSMVLESTNPDVGEAKDEIEVAYQDRELTVGYNVRYLIDAIEVVEGEKITFEIGLGMRPGVIRPVEGNRYMCIIMPLKIQ
ncbi:MAG: DNA polymerase III subunit beta [Deltaproteobacteria bacterium]|nr:DNA polymerase III subunit beta [Deltaproteobacteria bacterium]